MNDKKELKLILIAARNQLSSKDIKSLIAYLESDECEFEISLQISEPTEQPELLELHRLVAIPALIKISPAPKDGRTNVIQRGSTSLTGSQLNYSIMELEKLGVQWALQKSSF